MSLWAVSLVVLATVTGFDAPESAFFDEATGAYYVSNVAGSPTGKDGNGWISRLGRDGKLLDAKWVAGLNAPKGVAGARGKLYVADIDQVAVIDIKARKIVTTYKVEGARFLNDVAAAHNGDVYVSDTLDDAVYVLPGGGKPQLFMKGPELEGPNGLCVDGKSLVVAAWGHVVDPATFATKVPGRLLRVDLATKAVKPIGAAPLGHLDGVEKDGDGYWVTDWTAGKLLRVAADGKATEIKAGFNKSADLGYDPKHRQLVIPEMGGTTVQVLRAE